jgi:hypothetical protein
MGLGDTGAVPRMVRHTTQAGPAILVKTEDGGGRHPARYQAAERHRPRHRQLVLRSSFIVTSSSFIVTSMMPAMAGQRGHALCVLAMGRTEFLACGGHTRTCHVSAFGRGVRHRFLHKRIAPVSWSVDILLAPFHGWSRLPFGESRPASPDVYSFALAHPGWLHSHSSVVRSFAPSQAGEQYFSPWGGMHLQGVCAHFLSDIG